jgi:hypothetical protein
MIAVNKYVKGDVFRGKTDEEIWNMVSHESKQLIIVEYALEEIRKMLEYYIIHK